MASFEDILSQKVDEIKAPPTIPAGTYIAVVTGPPVQGEQQNENKTPFLEFKFNLLQPMDDVDREKLNAIGGIAGKSGKMKFFMTEDSMWRLDNFLFKHLGIELGKSRKEAVAESNGRQVLLSYKEQPSRDGTRMVSFPNETAAV